MRARDAWGTQGGPEVAGPARLLHVVRLLIAVFVFAWQAPSTAFTPPRSVAVTIDDLPGVSNAFEGCDVGALWAFTEAFTTMLREHAVPATAFVNLGRICHRHRDLFPVLLSRWTSAGIDLGNHTYSHLDLNRTDAATFIADARREEQILRRAQESAGRTLRWFRFPYLRTGDTTQKRHQVAAELARAGYTIAPVTFDNDEWIFAQAYVRAKRSGDGALQARIGAAYLEHMESSFIYFEDLSRRIFRREPAQILLLHANDLNLDFFPRLVEVLRRRGYRFVSLEEATRDPAYLAIDVYVGRRGLSWLHRWALSRGMEGESQPEAPQWVRIAASSD